MAAGRVVIIMIVSDDCRCLYYTCITHIAIVQIRFVHTRASQTFCKLIRRQSMRLTSSSLCMIFQFILDIICIGYFLYFLYFFIFTNAFPNKYVFDCYYCHWLVEGTNILVRMLFLFYLFVIERKYHKWR